MPIMGLKLLPMDSACMHVSHGKTFGVAQRLVLSPLTVRMTDIRFVVENTSSGRYKEVPDAYNGSKIVTNGQCMYACVTWRNVWSGTKIGSFPTDGANDRY
jgi:hypothetical protein